ILYSGINRIRDYLRITQSLMESCGALCSYRWCGCRLLISLLLEKTWSHLLMKLVSILSKLTIAISLALSLSFAAPNIQISPTELQRVGEQIYKNETGGKLDNLS